MKKLLLTTVLTLGSLGSTASFASDSIIRSNGEEFQVLDFKLNAGGPFLPAESAKVTTYKTEVDARDAAKASMAHDWDQIVNMHQGVYPGFVEAVKTVAAQTDIKILTFASRVKEANSLKNKVFDRIAGNTRETFVPGYAFNDLVGARFLLKNEKDAKSLMDCLLNATELKEFDLKARPSYDNINYAISVDFKCLPYLGTAGYEHPSIGEIQVWAKPTGMWLDQQHDTVYKGDKSSAYYKQLLNPFTSLHLFMCRILSTSDFQATIVENTAEGTKRAFDAYVLKMTEADYAKKLTDAFWGNIPEVWKSPNQVGRWTVESIQLMLNQLEARDRFDLTDYFVLN